MLKPKWIKRAVFIVVPSVLVVTNFTMLPYLIGLKPLMPVYHYVDASGKIIYTNPAKGREVNYATPGLRRAFRMNYLEFWNWYEYCTHPRWKLDYVSPTSE